MYASLFHSLECVAQREACLCNTSAMYCTDRHWCMHRVWPTTPHLSSGVSRSRRYHIKQVHWTPPKKEVPSATTQVLSIQCTSAISTHEWVTCPKLNGNFTKKQCRAPIVEDKWRAITNWGQVGNSHTPTLHASNQFHTKLGGNPSDMQCLPTHTPPDCLQCACFESWWVGLIAHIQPFGYM